MSILWGLLIVLVLGGYGYLYFRTVRRSADEMQAALDRMELDVVERVPAAHPADEAVGPIRRDHWLAMPAPSDRPLCRAN